MMKSSVNIRALPRDGVLTYAGLLMLGKNEMVRKYVNNFWVDYIEIPGNSYSEAAVRFLIGFRSWITFGTATRLSSSA